MEEMKKPEGAPVAQPAAQGKKPKSNFLTPVMVSFGAIVAFLLVWYFAVK